IRSKAAWGRRCGVQLLGGDHRPPPSPRAVLGASWWFLLRFTCHPRRQSWRCDSAARSKSPRSIASNIPPNQAIGDSSRRKLSGGWEADMRHAAGQGFDAAERGFLTYPGAGGVVAGWRSLEIPCFPEEDDFQWRGKVAGSVIFWFVPRID